MSDQHLTMAPSSSESSTIAVRRISATETAAIRHEVLWPSVPSDSQLLPFDFHPATLHFGAFGPSPSPPSSLRHSPADLIGCLTITHAPCDHPGDLSAICPALSSHYQLRKFAVLPQFQGKGIGRQLLLEAIGLLRRHAGLETTLLLHFDARETQSGFYAKLGFELLGNERFVKRGPTGNGSAVTYVRMGRVLD